MDKNDRPARFCDLNPHEVRMLVFDEKAVIVHLKDGSVLREEFPSSQALSEALDFWARKGQFFTEAHGPNTESDPRPSQPPS
jgi:hypothetical protein